MAKQLPRRLAFLLELQTLKALRSGSGNATQTKCTQTKCTDTRSPLPLRLVSVLHIDAATPRRRNSPPRWRRTAAASLGMPGQLPPAPFVRSACGRRGHFLHASGSTPASPESFFRRGVTTTPMWWQGTADAEGEADKALHPPEPLPPGQPSAKQKRELHAVNTAVTVNIAIFAAKVAVWAVTLSGSLLAEALHSLADIGNQVLLRAGVQQSRRTPTRQHPYGFHREKYVYALMSAVGMFCVGAGAAVLHGVWSLIDPPALEHMGWSLGVLGVSAVAEMYSLNVALQAIRLGAKEQGQSVMQFLLNGRDPTTAAILAEDAGAVAGLGIAGTASYLTWLTGNPTYDAVGSIAVGCVMGAVAMALIRNNKRFLIGQAMQPKVHMAIIEHLKGDPMVLCVIDPKSEELGDGVFRFKAEIQWSGDRVVHKYLNSLGRDSLYGQIRESACTAPGVPSDTLRDAMDLAMMEFGRGVIRTVGEEIDRLEEELKAMVPGLVYVDLETDRGRADLSSMECPVETSPQEEGAEQPGPPAVQ